MSRAGSTHPKTVLIRVNERAGVHPFLRETNVTGIYPALGIAYLAAAARDAGSEVRLIEAHAENFSHAQVVAQAAAFDPRLIGLTSTTFNWPVVAQLAAQLRQTLPDAIIAVGGPQLSLYPEECLAEEAIDIAVIGEGDDTLVELLGRIGAGDDPAGVPGTVVRSGDELIRGPDRPPIADLDRLPLPALDLLPFDRYRSLTLPRPFVSMVTSRGCPFHCRFCSQTYVGGCHREHGVDRVLEEIGRALEITRAREIVFFDETFTLSRDRVLAICEGILERGFRTDFNIRTRADLLDDDVLEALAQAGCSSIHVGIEAGSDRIRNLMNKRLDLDKGVRALGRARKLGMETRGYFMLGYPTETRQEMDETIRTACELPLDWASFTITSALPGTDIYTDSRENGRYTEDYWREYSLQRFSGPPGYASTDFTDDELEAVLSSAYRRFYLRPGSTLAKVTNRRLWRRLPTTLSTGFEILAQRIRG